MKYWAGVLLVALSAHGAERSPAAKAEFRRLNPCPSTGKTRGACPGYVIDHRKSLCSGGSDTPDNMQYQTVEAAGIKDRFEWHDCAELRRNKFRNETQ